MGALEAQKRCQAVEDSDLYMADLVTFKAICAISSDDFNDKSNITKPFKLIWKKGVRGSV